MRPRRTLRRSAVRRRAMKRWIALAVGATAALVVAAGPVAAAPGAQVAPVTAAPQTVPADALGLALANQTTKGLAVTLDAGAAEEHDLIVSNHTKDLRLTVK